MSDPVTNVEIEDVLASIKRLVSEESRAETMAPEPPGKLVLTPALRVAEPNVTDRGTPESGQDHLPEAPFSSSEDDLYTEDTEEPLRVESAELEACFADVVDAEDVIAEFRHVGDVEDAETVQTEEDNGAGDWDTVQPAQQAKTVPWDDIEDAEYDAVDDDTTEEQPALEAVEAPVYTTESKVEDATPDYDAYADEEDDLDDLAAVSAEDEAILDEETLRELVAEIVRQELQGALGERITRNVRKLVRREIHRALTSHELQ
ncbi:hypothetical protein TG4357_00857 [Thalassovita gelatinovora]|uniref:Uncharacterized protein n=1 Tax=Thalassovita gelatinovora TaxID=53501 RepID=A0A0P1F718_THAGE|nr:DUF2497 domain-containing protein [Thalassovita gelatinovora]QIZ82222.1 DUF2497 domain-containing protein [Thalassovita gelatinovora]CUH63734.1 hypothetical protein TG4357_00857 [Thalassovita gelatinovora]SEQ98523.1 hypothetical protein SAMN04488043_11295 [Thalassovita gelatinovora]